MTFLPFKARIYRLSAYSRAFRGPSLFLYRRQSSSSSSSPSSMTSTSIPTSTSAAVAAVAKNKRKGKDLFLAQDPSTAFAHRSTLSLIRSLLVFQICQLPWLVDATPRLLSITRRLGLARPINQLIIRHTFFKQFCGGQTSQDVIPVIRQLNESGIISILDLSIESDIGADVKDEAGRIAGVMHLVRDCIDTASNQPGTFVAVKVTALGPAEPLLHVSASIAYVKDLFLSQTGGSVDQEIGIDIFHSIVRKMPGGMDVGDDEVRCLFQKADSDNGDGKINWVRFLKTVNIGTCRSLFIGPIDFQHLTRDGQMATVSAKYAPTSDLNDFNEIQEVERRLEQLCEYAIGKGVKLMFDAEQSYFQPTIHYLANLMMKKYNRSGQPNVYNTYQLYLADGLQKLKIDYEQAVTSDRNYVFAAKLVRGAYMLSERERSEVLKIRDPIHKTIEDTHKSYDDAVEYLLEDPRAESSIVIASHNRHSVNLTCEIVDDLRKGGRVTKTEVMFAQLLGMHDHLTYTLAKYKFAVGKYVPYGPIEDVIPYLLRRAQENRSIFSPSNDPTSHRLSDINLLRKELKKRFSLFSKQ